MKLMLNSKYLQSLLRMKAVGGKPTSTTAY